jgi:hypothetical protein
MKPVQQIRQKVFGKKNLKKKVKVLEQSKLSNTNVFLDA